VTVSIVQHLLTAEQYSVLPDRGAPTELVRGRIIPLNPPTPEHGLICSRLVRIVAGYVEERDIGRVTCNDAGIVTERGPDTVRGADVAFYSYQRWPRGSVPQGYLAVLPELVFEVRSRTDRWSRVLARVTEYLEAGVDLVCVLDPITRTARVYRCEHPETVFTTDENLIFPEILGEGLHVSLRELLP
jgi:Uma2 family endonuclease